MTFNADVFINYITLFTQGMLTGFLIGFFAWGIGFVVETFIRLLKS